VEGCALALQAVVELHEDRELAKAAALHAAAVAMADSLARARARTNLQDEVSFPNQH
jgi:hypothetical protein